MKRLSVPASALLVLVGMAAAVGAQDATYISAAKCKMCHSVEYKSWATTRHAKATDTAKASTEWAFEAACLSCHATNADEALAGVQCEACHGPGSSYKSISIMKDRDKAVAAGLLIPTQATCDRCHDGRDHHAKKEYTVDVHAHKK